MMNMKIISNFFQRNEKWLTPTALLGGFIIDNLTLRRSDLLLENLLLAFYFVVAMLGVLVWHKFESRRTQSQKHLEYQSIIFLVTQFAFGGLFSSLTVFYIKSASFFASWPFLLVLFGGMIATEYFKKHFTQFLVQLATLYVLLFTYLILIVPLIVRAINPWVFVLSGILSLVAIFGYVFAFNLYIPKLIEKKESLILIVIGSIFALINIFYFTNIIPPIPLALRDSGVYKLVEKNENTYTFVSFQNKFSLKSFKQEYVVPAGAPIYFYSSIYAPIKFNQKVAHKWQKKNNSGEWITVARVEFPIFGGSDAGYRGYSFISNRSAGEYRVFVETNSGQVLSVEHFVVK